MGLGLEESMRVNPENVSCAESALEMNGKNEENSRPVLRTAASLMGIYQVNLPCIFRQMMTVDFDYGAYTLSMNWVKMVCWVDSMRLAPMI